MIPGNAKTVIFSSAFQELLEAEERNNANSRTAWFTELYSWLRWRVSETVMRLRNRNQSLTLTHKAGRVLVGYMPTTARYLTKKTTVKYFGKPKKVRRDAPWSDALLRRQDWWLAPRLVEFRSKSHPGTTNVYYFHPDESVEIALYAKLEKDRSRK